MMMWAFILYAAALLLNGFMLYQIHCVLKKRMNKNIEERLKAMEDVVERVRWWPVDPPKITVKFTDGSKLTDADAIWHILEQLLLRVERLDNCGLGEGIDQVFRPEPNGVPPSTKIDLPADDWFVRTVRELGKPTIYTFLCPYNKVRYSYESYADAVAERGVIQAYWRDAIEKTATEQGLKRSPNYYVYATSMEAYGRALMGATRFPDIGNTGAVVHIEDQYGQAYRVEVTAESADEVRGRQVFKKGDA